MSRIVEKSEFARATLYARQKGFALKSYFIHCIRYGDPEGIDGVFEDAENMSIIRKALGDNVEFTRLSLLYLWAQMELACVWGGVREEDATALHFEYAQQAVGSDSVSELLKLNALILHDYAVLVKSESENLGKYAPVHKCKQYIEEHLYEGVDAGQVAERFHFSNDYLSRLFKDIEGVPLATYIRNRKLDEAATLLVGTSLEIVDISSRLGFSTQSHFSSLFKKTHGMTPREYRARKGQGMVVQ